MEMTHHPIVTQPQAHRYTRSFEWQTDLCDCGSDCRVYQQRSVQQIVWFLELCPAGTESLCGTFCFSCLGCQIADDMEECCCCGPSVAMRTRYRTLYKIPGSICSDCLTVVCCAPCNLCQLKRDINRRKQLGIF